MSMVCARRSTERLLGVLPPRHRAVLMLAYGIYLAHVLVLQAIFGLLARLGHPASGAGYVVVGVALGVPAAVLISAATGALGRRLRVQVART
jgi:peptidoglycan/LPS O-acetylase OafA/YrhL